MGQGSEDERNGVTRRAGTGLFGGAIGDPRCRLRLGLRLGLLWRAACEGQLFAWVGGWSEEGWRSVKHGGCVAAGRRWHLSCSSQRQVVREIGEKDWVVIWECKWKSFKLFDDGMGWY